MQSLFLRLHGTAGVQRDYVHCVVMHPYGKILSFMSIRINLRIHGLDTC